MSIVHTLVSIIIQAINLLIIGRIIISFIPNMYNNPIGRFIYDTSEPILAPIRRMLPDTGMIDFSPLVLFIILNLIQRFLP